jgi:hypothetical protein
MAQKKLISEFSLFLPYDPLKERFVINGNSRKRIVYSKGHTIPFGAKTFSLDKIKRVIDRLQKKNKNLKVAEIFTRVELTNLP